MYTAVQAMGANLLQARPASLPYTARDVRTLHSSRRSARTCNVISMPTFRSKTACPFSKRLQQQGSVECSSQFTLHGLWPNYQRGHCPGKPGAWPQNCDDSSTDLPPECDCPFQQELIADLTPVMSVDWPGYGYSNAEFWQHEWDKHGKDLRS